MFWSKTGRIFFIKQSGYVEKSLFYIFFSFIIEQISSVQGFHFRQQGFVIFLTGATETDFFILVGETT